MFCNLETFHIISFISPNMIFQLTFTQKHTPTPKKKTTMTHDGIES